MEDGSEHEVTNPSYWPEGKVREVYEPMAKCTVIRASEYTGAIMELCQSRRGELGGMDYLSETRVELRYTLPMGEIMFDFFDALKSRTKGYASLDYEESGEQQAALVKVDILLQGETVDAFSAIVHKDAAFAYGNKMTTKFARAHPPSAVRGAIQAAIGSKIIARENIRAIRKDVLAKCYGGDISRKRKLLEKQKEGKKRMKTIGRVEVPQEAFVAALSNESVADKPRASSRRQVEEHSMIGTWLTRELGLEVPIFGAPMGGRAGGRLAGEVTRAGGLGLLGAARYATPEWIRRGVGDRSRDRRRAARHRADDVVSRRRRFTARRGARRAPARGVVVVRRSGTVRRTGPRRGCARRLPGEHARRPARGRAGGRRLRHRSGR